MSIRMLLQVFKKPWPPMIGDHDWEVGLYNLRPLWTRYNSWEVVPPMWALRRAQIIAQQYAYGAAKQGRATPEAKPSLQTPSTLDQALRRQFPQEFEVRAAMRLAKQMDPSIERRSDLVAWLEGHGYNVRKDGVNFYAERPA